jgi:hypothetical protein
VQVILAIVLLAAEAIAPLPPQIVTACQAYATGPARDWCLRTAAKSLAEDREMDAVAQVRTEAEEAERARRAATDADTERRVAAVEESQRTPEAMQFSWSAWICDRQGERTEAIAAIKKEHRYSKIGGVVHLGRLGELQDDVASADEDIAEYRSELRAIRKPALPCKYVAAHRE